MEDADMLITHLLIKNGIIDKNYFGRISLVFEKGNLVHCASKKSGKELKDIVINPKS
jgi:hypothetical protein